VEHAAERVACIPRYRLDRSTLAYLTERPRKADVLAPMHERHLQLPRSATPCAIVNNLGLPVGVAVSPPLEQGIGFEHVTKLEDARRTLSTAQFNDFREAYGAFGSHSAIDSLRASFAAVEALVHAGASVVFAQPAYTGREDRQFDTHHDDIGKVAREIMAPITPMLATFLDRVMAMPGRNVVTLLTGEFSRTLPGADHAKGGTATVIGKYVRTGAIGRQQADGSPPDDAPPPEALWAFIASALRLSTASREGLTSAESQLARMCPLPYV
jgi:hypothetical protein